MTYAPAGTDLAGGVDGAANANVDVGCEVWHDNRIEGQSGEILKVSQADLSCSRAYFYSKGEISHYTSLFD